MSDYDETWDINNLDDLELRLSDLAALPNTNKTKHRRAIVLSNPLIVDQYRKKYLNK